MKKLLLSLMLIGIVNSVFAQFDYSADANAVPTKGPQFGFVGGGFTAMLNNRDDINADLRLDPQTMNFSYGGGLEYIYWFQNNVGFGGQLNYWIGGAAYTGKDTLYPFYDMSMSAKTTMTYAKLPLLFHFKSYNRYYPNKRLRFNAYFGPYIAYLLSYNDKVRYYNDSAKYDMTTVLDGKNFETTFVGNPNVGKSKVSSEVYNKFDVGFVFALGGEMRLWRRTVLALHLRTDVGISNVENTRGMKIYNAKPDGTYPINDPGTDFNYWDSNYAKYTAPNAIDALLGWKPNRPATKNFSVGAFISLRKYF